MSKLPLLEPADCALILVDEQAGLAFAAGSQDPQILRSNGLAVAKTAVAFDLPVVVSTSASKVYSGPLMPAFREVLPNVTPIERRNMNLWEDDAVRDAITATGKRTLIIAGMLTEACVSFPVLSALSEGYQVHVVADACGGLTPTSHDLALRRMASAGAVMTSWLQLLLEFQRDWTRHDTYEKARSIVVEHGGGYGTGLAYARDMIKPT
ncbi:hydrolase [Cupriavidus sp. D39]|uniref:hydrolase n=1 Tax=Cupriavidus sp. D39 TaxID=2997877 RepID=UPI0022701B71|nr:hydrolase [Cupriavidus sp. D39]MCY0855421.1 hydrolase [Cupriavidus sp. D39]